MPPRIAPLALATALALLHQSGHAQTVTPSAGASPDATPAAPQTLDTIQVSGYRGSLMKAIDNKRSADAIVDSINAEDIGKFPDANVAESLSHVPGVTVDYAYGEGEKVSIQGTDPALNRTLLNGQTVASTDWGGASYSQTRTFNYSTLAPELLAAAEVYKTPEARIVEGSVGGTVILHTRKPLDMDANTVTGSAGVGYNDRSDRFRPNGSALYSWKNEAGTFGVLASYMHRDEWIQREGIDVYGYPKVAGAGFPANLAANAGNAVYPNSVSTGLIKQHRKRDTGSVDLQFKPSDQLEFNVNALYVDADYTYFNNSRYSYAAASPGAATALGIEDGVATSGSFGNSAVTEHDATNKMTRVKTSAITGQMDFHGDAWTMSAVVGTTKSTGGVQKQYFMELPEYNGYRYAIDGDKVSLDYATPSVPSAIKVGNGSYLGGIGRTPLSDQEKYLQLDFTRNLQLGPFYQLLWGAKREDHRNTQTVWSQNLRATGTVSLADVASGMTDSDYLSGISASPDMRNWTLIDRQAMIARLDQAAAGGAYKQNYASSYAIHEINTSAYLQGNFSGERYRGNIGVRYARTTDDMAGYTVLTSGSATPVAVSQGYGKWLPSANFVYDLREDLLLRLAAAKTIARPRYQDLAPSVSQNDTVLSASGGNPNLKPYQSNNFNASLEWYYADDALLSVDMFYKDIASYVVTRTSSEVLYNTTSGGYNTYTTTRPYNAADATVKGLSVAWQGTFGYGFGMMANYTFSDAKASVDYNLPYNSRNAINVTPYWEQGPWSVRVTGSWRSKYFTGIGRVGAKLMTDAYTNLGVSVSYQLTPALQLDFNASNLLDEQYYNYNGSPSEPMLIYKSGRVYDANLRFKF
ncbi:iron complex outermembrane receptor protein [Xanthomonas sacchari]|nr:iron complex outermembrane receptor protein [Xanthomonas sacchari]